MHAEDVDGLIDAVRQFLVCNNKNRLGQNAKQYYTENFTRAQFMNHLEKEIELNCKKKPTTV